MADPYLDFLSLYGPADASLTVILPEGAVSRIDNICRLPILSKCPLLYFAFDDGPSGTYQASLEASSLSAVVSFLRYLYTGNYLTYAEEIGSCSLLKHAQVYKMASNFDVPQLEVDAHVNFIRETEMSCCIPTPPIDFCQAIRFVYAHLASQQPLIDTLLNYCVSTFNYHDLANNVAFRQVAYELPEFHRALCQTSFRRDFQDDGASGIINLPVCRSNPHSVVFDKDLHVDLRTQAEFQFEEWYDAEVQLFKADSGSESEDHAEERTTKRRKIVSRNGPALVHRPKRMKKVETSENEDASEEDGFTLVHRPKAKSTLTNDLTDLSSPELIPALTDNTGSPFTTLVGDDSDASDWSLV